MIPNSRAFLKPAYLAQCFFGPVAEETGEAGLGGEELLHGGLFEVALLGDQPVQPAQQPIHIAQRLRDGALLGERGKWNRIIGHFSPIDLRHSAPNRYGLSVSREWFIQENSERISRDNVFSCA